jgi:hypothetical protein
MYRSIYRGIGAYTDGQEHIQMDRSIYGRIGVYTDR